MDKGVVMIYKGLYTSDKDIPAHIKITSPYFRGPKIAGNGKKAKKVAARNCNGEIVNRFDSATKAGKHYNIHPNAIINACIGKTNTSCGLTWEYVFE